MQGNVPVDSPCIRIKSLKDSSSLFWILTGNCEAAQNNNLYSIEEFRCPHIGFNTIADVLRHSPRFPAAISKRHEFSVHLLLCVTLGHPTVPYILLYFSY